ncbi:MAG: DoxX family protein [Bacteroidota bacterium]
MTAEKLQLIYWISTGLLCAVLLWSAYTYFFQEAAIAGIKALGFPDFFRIQLAILKLLAIAALLLPVVPMYMKEWAYAGVGLFFLTAIVAHIAHRDGVGITGLLLVFFALLIASHVTLHRLQTS